jgi:hypothetical protein
VLLVLPVRPVTPPPYEPRLATNFIVPEAEAVKARSESGNARFVGA